MLRLLTLLLLCGPVIAQLRPDQVLVVVNDASPVSRAIGAYYVTLRDIPPENVVHLPPWSTTAEEIGRLTFNEEIADPIRVWITLLHPELESRIRVIVTTKGVPLKIDQIGGDILTRRDAAVDSELTQLLTGNVPVGGQPGRLSNPYFGADVSFAELDHPGISHLVCRLTAYDGPVDGQHGVPIDLKRLLDRAQSPAQDGVFVFDMDQTPTADADHKMMAGAALARDLGFQVLEDFQDPMLANVPNILGYFSWGSNDPNSPAPPYWGEVPPGSGQVYPGHFASGAFAHTFVSTNGRTFTKGMQAYGQSLVADLIHRGVTNMSGHVYEPIADAVAHPDLLIHAFARGFTAAEAYYQSLPHLSWMTVVVCDPLMTYDFRPELHAVLPAAAKVGDLVMLKGLGFTNAADTEVRIDTALVRSLQVVDAQTMIARVPPDSIRPGSRPGGPTIGPRVSIAGAALDVSVTNTRGQAHLDDGLTVTPSRR
ncbi:MAG: TIGR03790 family protein [Planctomycetota bacterium]